MNLDANEDLNDAARLDDPEMAEILTPLRHRDPLRFTQVRKLVETLDMGRKRHANIEAYGSGTWGRWRLRFSLRDGTGKVTRKSIVIEDALIADWVREYLEQARKERPAYRLELKEKEHRKRLDENSAKRLASRIASIMRGNAGTAAPQTISVTDAVAPTVDAVMHQVEDNVDSLRRMFTLSPRNACQPPAGMGEKLVEADGALPACV